MRTRKRYYIGFPPFNGTTYSRAELILSASVPTEESHGDRFISVTGPFRDKRAALWAIKNPFFVHVSEANRKSRGE